MRAPGIRLGALLVTAVVCLPFAAGDHPVKPSMDCGYVQYVPPDAEESTFPVYLTVDELNSNDYLVSFWLYAESNGMDGLQRYDAYCRNGPWAENHDLLVF